jgi:hypothetical protein
MARDDVAQAALRPQGIPTDPLARLALLSPAAVAKLLGIGQTTLAKWRSSTAKYASDRPKLRFRKVGGKAMYLQSDVEEYLAAIASDAPPKPAPKEKRKRRRKAA